MIDLPFPKVNYETVISEPGVYQRLRDYDIGDPSFIWTIAHRSGDAYGYVVSLFVHTGENPLLIEPLYFESWEDNKDFIKRTDIKFNVEMTGP